MKIKNDTENRRLILETARNLYYERGMDEVPFDEIAEVCGVTKSLIRYHFGSKAHLANELFGIYSREQLNVFLKKHMPSEKSIIRTILWGHLLFRAYVITAATKMP